MHTPPPRIGRNLTAATEVVNDFDSWARLVGSFGSAVTHMLACWVGLDHEALPPHHVIEKVHIAE
jgi:hypothetical protein